MFDGDNGGGLIDHPHDHAAMHIAAHVGVQPVREAAGGAARIGDGSSLAQINLRQSLMPGAHSLKRVHTNLLQIISPVAILSLSMAFYHMLSEAFCS